MEKPKSLPPETNTNIGVSILLNGKEYGHWWCSGNKTLTAYDVKGIVDIFHQLLLDAITKEKMWE